MTNTLGGIKARHVRDANNSPLATAPVARPDAAILGAWERRQNAYTAYHARPIDQPGLEPGEFNTPEEKRLWAIIEEAEEVIRSATATAVRGASIQLWTCLNHSVTGREDDAAITRGDLARLERIDTDLSWNARLALAALRSLQAMEAA